MNRTARAIAAGIARPLHAIPTIWATAADTAAQPIASAGRLPVMATGDRAIGATTAPMAAPTHRAIGDRPTTTAGMMTTMIGSDDWF
jgi:hypothetical protein